MSMQARRFIPTYVGLIPGSRPGGATRPVHPHIRGVNTQVRSANSILERFIPTYVGLIYGGIRIDYKKTVHPHIRGVNVVPGAPVPDVRSSSPHTWG